MTDLKVTELFRYYGNLGFAEQVLDTKEIFCPNPESFNDPFDCSIPLHVECTANELRDAITLKYDKEEDRIRLFSKYFNKDGTISDLARSTIEGTAQEFISSNQKLGVFCLTENCASILMWSHYAKNHTGICVGFARAPGNELGDDDVCARVKYDDTYPTPRFAQIFKGDASLTFDLFNRKGDEWKYEKEWRFLSPNSDRKYPIPGPITRVILGCRIKSTDRDHILQKCLNERIPVFQANRVKGEFKLSIDIVSSL